MTINALILITLTLTIVVVISGEKNSTKIEFECRDDDGSPDIDSKSCIFHDIISTSANTEFNYISSEDKNWVKFKNSILYQIPPDLFKNYINLQTLDVTACQIEFVSSESFTHADNLLYLHMKGNNLTRLGHGIFTGAPNLEDLKLQFNQINEIEEQAFSGLENLKYLYLGKNQLSVLYDGTFRELVKLESLDLSYNNLLEISDELLRANKMLDILDVRGNKLAVIGATAFKNLEKLSSLDIAGNNLKKFQPGTLMYLTNLRSFVAFENQLQEIDFTWHDNTGCAVTNNGTRMILPRLTKISLAENKWNCTYIKNLLDTLEVYDIRQLPYKLLHEQDAKPNVKGIACEKLDTDNEREESKLLAGITKEQVAEARKCIATKSGY